MVGLSTRISQVVMQPTTLCNLDCAYCYLPHRAHRRTMNVSVARTVASSLPLGDRPLPISWHAGEPLATGREHFRSLLAPFEDLRRAGRIQHVVQTNATLLSDAWIDLLLQHDFIIGVSIDGAAALNQQRVDWAGEEAYSRIMKGIALLQERRVSFHAIAVVSQGSLPNASVFFEFFAGLGCETLGINIEESVGTHRGAVLNDSSVHQFWQALFKEWRANPSLEIREIRHVLGWMHSVASGSSGAQPTLDLLPSVAYNGDVVLLSPEFVGLPTDRYNTFVVGNVEPNGLRPLLHHAANCEYVSDYANGIKRCQSSCEYFDGCGGRSAANKFFETGSTDATITRYCLNSSQLPAQAILDTLTLR